MTHLIKNLPWNVLTPMIVILIIVSTFLVFVPKHHNKQRALVHLDELKSLSQNPMSGKAYEIIDAMNKDLNSSNLSLADIGTDSLEVHKLAILWYKIEIESLISALDGAKKMPLHQIVEISSTIRHYLDKSKVKSLDELNIQYSQKNWEEIIIKAKQWQIYSQNN